MDNKQQDVYESMRLDGLIGSSAPVEPVKKDRSWLPWAALLGAGTAVLLALLTMM